MCDLHPFTNFLEICSTRTSSDSLNSNCNIFGLLSNQPPYTYIDSISCQLIKPLGPSIEQEIKRDQVIYIPEREHDVLIHVNHGGCLVEYSRDVQFVLFDHEVTLIRNNRAIRIYGKSSHSQIVVTPMLTLGRLKDLNEHSKEFKSDELVEYIQRVRTMNLLQDQSEIILGSAESDFCILQRFVLGRPENYLDEALNLIQNESLRQSISKLNLSINDKRGKFHMLQALSTIVLPNQQESKSSLESPSTVTKQVLQDPRGILNNTSPIIEIRQEDESSLAPSPPSIMAPIIMPPQAEVFSLPPPTASNPSLAVPIFHRKPTAIIPPPIVQPPELESSPSPQPPAIIPPPISAVDPPIEHIEEFVEEKYDEVVSDTMTNPEFVGFILYVFMSQPLSPSSCSYTVVSKKDVSLLLAERFSFRLLYHQHVSGTTRIGTSELESLSVPCRDCKMLLLNRGVATLCDVDVVKYVGGCWKSADKNVFGYILSQYKCDLHHRHIENIIQEFNTDFVPQGRHGFTNSILRRLLNLDDHVKMLIGDTFHTSAYPQASCPPEVEESKSENAVHEFVGFLLYVFLPEPLPDLCTSLTFINVSPSLSSAQQFAFRMLCSKHDFLPTTDAELQTLAAPCSACKIVRLKKGLGCVCDTNTLALIGRSYTKQWSIVDSSVFGLGYILAHFPRAINLLTLESMIRQYNELHQYRRRGYHAFENFMLRGLLHLKDGVQMISSTSFDSSLADKTIRISKRKIQEVENRTETPGPQAKRTSQEVVDIKETSSPLAQRKNQEEVEVISEKKQKSERIMKHAIENQMYVFSNVYGKKISEHRFLIVQFFETHPNFVNVDVPQGDLFRAMGISLQKNNYFREAIIRHPSHGHNRSREISQTLKNTHPGIVFWIQNGKWHVRYNKAIN